MVSSRLLDAAIDRFARYGYEGASTREIAKASQTTMSSITYHFGGKLGLYLAAVDCIVGSITDRLGPAIDRIAARDLATADDAIDASIALMDDFAVMMLSPEAAPWSRFIIREQFDATEAFERIWDGVMARTAAIFDRLIAQARPDLAEQERHAMSILLFGQAITLRASRATVCRILGVDAIGTVEGGILRARLAANIRAILKR